MDDTIKEPESELLERASISRATTLERGEKDYP
jgi:hypothetical protein